MLPSSPLARSGAARSAPLLLLALPLLLSGCSGTPFGEALSRSFSGAAPADPPSALAPTPGAPPPSAAVPAGGQRPAPTAARPATVAGAPATPAKPATPTAATPVTGLPAAPAPYRITILLPQADPAAPAEVVTRALRAAGVPFEVETIQRTAGQPSTAPGTGSPGAAAAPATPTVRPAPPPR
jgi:hypothetical protein